MACSLAGLIRKQGLRTWRDGGRRSNWQLARRIWRRCARSPARERNRRAGSSERGFCWPTGRTHRFSRWGEPWAHTIRRSSAVSSGRWPMVRCRRSTIARGPAGRRRSPPRPRHGLSTSPAARPRTSAIPTNCGRRGCSPAMCASMGRQKGTLALPSWLRARCATSSMSRRSSRTRSAITWNAATRSSSRGWRRFCASIAR